MSKTGKVNITNAFTLFEIMSIVVILGFIIAIAFPNYRNAKNQALGNIYASNQKMIFTVATLYQLRETDSLVEMENGEHQWP